MTSPSAKLLVVWTTETNATRQMANAVVEGARSVQGVSVTSQLLYTGTEMTPDEVVAFDGVILGTPMRHRNMHHRIKRFVEATLEVAWLDDRMVGKVGGVFTVGGGHGDMGAGAELAQLGMLSALAANGMVLVSFPKCTPGADEACVHWGPAARSGDTKMQPLWLTDGMLQAGFHHGANVARVTQVVAAAGHSLFASGNQAPSQELIAAFSQGTTGEVPDADANPAYRVDPE